MKLAEALALAEAGARVRCDALPLGSVVKMDGTPTNPDDKEFVMPKRLRVVFEATGAGFDFQAKAEHEAAEWHKVEGWANYAN